jgi:1-acyl-sn-glycerol-3-phosphate acyltransferase
MRKIFLAGYSLFFYFLCVVFSLLFIPLMSLGVSMTDLFLGHRRAMKRFRRAISHYGWVIIHILPLGLIRLSYKDLETGDSRPPFIFVANHRSASDPFLMACLPYECIQVVNAWPFKLPVFGNFASWAGYLNVRRLPFDEFKKRAVKLLSRGVSIIVFPEGTRSGSKIMGQFHGAIFRVALETGAPIVPICLMGNERTPAKGSFIMEPALIRVHRLAALRKEEYQLLSPFKLKNLVRERIQGYIDKVEGEG